MPTDTDPTATTGPDGPAHELDPDWGVAPVTPMEAMMWRAEADPRLASDGVVFEVLDSIPDFDRLRAAHGWAVKRLPRLGERLVDDPLHLGPPAWVPAEIDLDRLVTRETRDSLDATLALAAELHEAPFDARGPLWRAILVDGLPDGQAVYLLKVNHVLADGMAFIAMFDILHSERREPTTDKPVVRAEPRRAVSPIGLTVRNALRLARSAPGIVPAATATALRTLRDPVGRVRGTVGWTRSLGRVTAAKTGEPSPLLRDRSLGRALLTYEVPVAELRAAGKAVGGSLNDAYLAALAVGFHRYHAAHGVEVGDLPMAMPVSLRRKEEATAGGNNFAGARIGLPAGLDDPAEAIRIIRARVRAVRDEPALDFLGQTAGLVSRFPTPALTRLTVSFTGALDLQASNFPGLQRPSYLAGARILRAYPFGPVPGCAVMATLISHESTCCIGIALDTAAVKDVPLFSACMREGLDAVLALRG